MLQPKDTDWLSGYKHKTHIYAVYKKLISDLHIHINWKWEDGKYIFRANGNQKKAGVAILISDKIYLKMQNITRYKKGPCITIKGSIQVEDIAIVNICALNIGAPQCIKQTLTDIKGETDSKNNSRRL